MKKGLATGRTMLGIVLKVFCIFCCVELAVLLAKHDEIFTSTGYTKKTSIQDDTDDSRKDLACLPPSNRGQEGSPACSASKQIVAQLPIAESFSHVIHPKRTCL